MNLHHDSRPLQEIDTENLSSKKVFIQYPIPKICNLRCEYCFHQEFFQGRPDSVKYATTRGFTKDEFKLWMDTHIYPNFDEIVIHAAGGEPFHLTNRMVIEGIFQDIESRVRVDFLTNGLWDRKSLSHIKGHHEKIHRVGFTFHRKTIGKNDELVKRFHYNVLTLAQLGIPVYVKELLFKDKIMDILKAREMWALAGIPFKIQDVQPLDDSPQDYNFRDLVLIDDEYKHQGHYCSCWQGWRSISIRGYDIAAGNVVACWLDPKIIGNVADNTLSLDFGVEIESATGRRNVTGGEYSYSTEGTFNRDRKPCEH